MAQDQALQNMGEMLLHEGLITEKQLLAAQQTQRETDQPLGRILVEMGLISEDVKMDLLRRKTGFKIVDLDGETIDVNVLQLLDPSVARKHHIVPVRMDRDGFVLAIEDPTNITLLDHIEGIVKMKVQPVIASQASIESALEKYRELEPEETQDGKTPLYLRRPFWYRLCEGAFLPLLVIGPPAAFAGVVIANPDAQEFLAEFQSAYRIFDVFLYSLLGFGLWGVIVFNIDGFIFKRSLRPVKSQPEQET